MLLSPSVLLSYRFPTVAAGVGAVTVTVTVTVCYRCCYCLLLLLLLQLLHSVTELCGHPDRQQSVGSEAAYCYSYVIVAVYCSCYHYTALHRCLHSLKSSKQSGLRQDLLSAIPAPGCRVTYLLYKSTQNVKCCHGTDSKLTARFDSPIVCLCV